MDYATPSSRFARNQQQDPAPPMNFYAPPRTPDYSNSGVMNSGADSSGTLPPSQPKYYRPAPDATRPGATPPPGAESYGVPILQGLQDSGVPATTDLGSNVASVAGNTLAGAATGALSGAAIGAAGGPIGAVGGAVIGGGVALITSGLNAWLGNKQARAERDRQNAVNAAAIKLRQQEIARDEKWRVQNRLDTLEQARYQRRIAAQADAQKAMNDTANKLQGMLSTNQSLKDHWAKFGFN